MIKALIVDDDLKYAKFILNMLINRFNNINVSHIATDGQEALDIISSNNFDLIFLDLKMPIINGLDIIDVVNTSNYVTKPNFIIISGDLPLIEIAKHRMSIPNIINKTDSIETICKKLEPIINEISYFKQLPQVKEYILSELLNLGYDFKLKGTKYIMQSILYIYKNNNMDLLDNLEQNVLKHIACENQKTVLNIKTSIIKATNLINNTNSVRNTPKSIISVILIHLFNKFNC